jgi:uncharacterized membrane protein YgaE (UPF0421/DUF939 family)
MTVRITANLRVSRRIPLLQALKTSVAVVLAWVISQWLLPGELPIFAAMAAIFVVQPSVNQSLGRALERSLGVVGGVLVALAIGIMFGQDSWIVLAATVLCILLAWALKLSPGSANQIPISAMLVLTLGAATPTYARDRIIETILGAAIAVIINAVIVPPVLLTPAHDAVTRLTDEIAATFDRVANALLSPQKYADLETLMIQARLLRPMLAKAERAISQAEESLTLNPRQARHREVLDADTALYARVTSGTNRAGFLDRAGTRRSRPSAAQRGAGPVGDPDGAGGGTARTHGAADDHDSASAALDPDRRADGRPAPGSRGDHRRVGCPHAEPPSVVQPAARGVHRRNLRHRRDATAGTTGG